MSFYAFIHSFSYLDLLIGYDGGRRRDFIRGDGLQDVKEVGPLGRVPLKAQIHNLLYNFWRAGRRGHRRLRASEDDLLGLGVGLVREGIRLAVAEDLPQQDAVAPDVGLRVEYALAQGLRGQPPDGHALQPLQYEFRLPRYR